MAHVDTDRGKHDFTQSVGDDAGTAQNTMPVSTSGREPGSLDGARRKALPQDPEPRLATIAADAPDGDDWLHEIKFDGYRLMARLECGTVQLLTRNGKDWSGRFPVLRKRLATLSVDSALLDGEIVALDSAGISRFGVLQDAIANAHTDDLIYQLFDLLYLDGIDLTRVALIERKQALATLLGKDPPPGLRYCDHIRGQGSAFFEAACRKDLEGIISKRADGGYSGGRSKQWRKVKCGKDDSFVVGGFTDPTGARHGLGALLLGTHDADGKLQYAGRVGTGFSARLLQRLHDALQEITTDTRPFAGPVPDAEGAHWVAPVLVVDVAFTERTASGVLRHPSFRGVRQDRDAARIGTHASAAPARLPRQDGGTSRDGRSATVAGMRLTHPDRILFSEAGLSKHDLAEYYQTIAEWILPQLADRPLSLLRCPEGRGEECFFQKHPQSAIPASVPRSNITEKDGSTGTYVHVHTAADLVGLVQAGTLEIHPWGSRVDAVDKPDRLVFDLDPAPDVGWPRVLAVARSLRQRLEDLGLAAFVRTTGGKGLHLVVPIERRSSWDAAKAFSRAVCVAHAHDDPSRLTINMSKSARHGKIFLDYLRNGRGATAIASYGTRARPQAPVAVPLRWDELRPSLGPDHYHVGNVPQRLAALRTDPWADLTAAARRITRAMQQAVGMDI